jgi:hypothetical protein
MQKKISGDLPVDVVFILQRLLRRTFTKIVTPGKTSAAGQMRSLRPDLVVPFHIVIGGLDPCPVVLTRCFLRFMNGPPHRAKKPRLKARQIISAIGIQHRAMVVNLENKVAYHPARQFYSPISQQGADDELTIPYISLKRRLGTTYLFVR